MICKTLPAIAFDKARQALWRLVFEQLSFPHAWVKYESAKLVGLLATELSGASGDGRQFPIRASSGLLLIETDCCDLTYRHLRLLRDGVMEDLASQAIRNLAFLGKIFAETGITWTATPIKQSSTAADSMKDISEDEADDPDVEDEEEDGEPENPEIKDKSALDHLLTNLSHILRRESSSKNNTPAHMRQKASLTPRVASLHLLSALCSTLPLESLEPSLDSILYPLVQLTDASLVAPISHEPGFSEAYTELVSNATELIDTVQKRLGTTEFVRVLQGVKGKIEEKRDERRRKRRIQAVTMPEVVERRKMRMREKEKVKRKVRMEGYKGRRRGW